MLVSPHTMALISSRRISFYSSVHGKAVHLIMAQILMDTSIVRLTDKGNPLLFLEEN
mgnify:CR=1 FL=1